MIELLILIPASLALLKIAEGPRGSIPPASPYRHPSFKPVVHSTISREQWAKHDRPFLGPVSDKAERRAKLNKAKHKKRKKA